MIIFHQYLTTFWTFGLVNNEITDFCNDSDSEMWGSWQTNCNVKQRPDVSRSISSVFHVWIPFYTASEATFCMFISDSKADRRIEQENMAHDCYICDIINNWLK